MRKSNFPYVDYYCLRSLSLPLHVVPPTVKYWWNYNFTHDYLKKSFLCRFSGERHPEQKIVQNTKFGGYPRNDQPGKRLNYFIYMYCSDLYSLKWLCMHEFCLFIEHLLNARHVALLHNVNFRVREGPPMNRLQMIRPDKTLWITYVWLMHDNFDLNIFSINLPINESVWAVHIIVYIVFCIAQFILLWDWIVFCQVRSMSIDATSSTVSTLQDSRKSSGLFPSASEPLTASASLARPESGSNLDSPLAESPLSLRTQTNKVSGNKSALTRPLQQDPKLGRYQMQLNLFYGLQLRTVLHWKCIVFDKRENRSEVFTL